MCLGTNKTINICGEDNTTGRYFGTDGFRGEAGVSITAEHAFKIGRILGYYYGGRTGGKCRALIGKDTRRSSYMLEYALAAGLTSSGADAYILHVTTTPSVSYITRSDSFDCGIMISASHNPYYDNGIKLLNGSGEKMEDEVIEYIENYLGRNSGEWDIPFVSGKDIGRTVDYVSGRNRYIGHVISLSTCSYKGLRVGLDAANGSAWQIAGSVFNALGAKTFLLGDSPDGTNVNEKVGSTHIEILRDFVIKNDLDIGFAFDGDADRCIAVDGKGRVLTGDEELYICAKYLKARGELSGNKIVCTVMSNGGLISSLENAGIECAVCGVGDKFVYETMQKTGAVLGGERSGHLVFSKYETTGDGILTAIMIMEAVINGGGDLLKGYKEYPQISESVPVIDKEKAMEGIAETVYLLERELNVRIVARPSGTERVIRIMAEGESEENCVLACKILITKISNKN